MISFSRNAVFLGLILTIGLSGCSHRTDWAPFGAAQAVDQDRNIYIPGPEGLAATLRVGVVYNQTHIQVRYEFETDHPSWYHDYLVYRNGSWHTLGGANAGPSPTGLYEDRISMALDDGSVEGFAEFGGYVTMHPGVAGRTDAAPEETEKFIRPSRAAGPSTRIWDQPRPDDELARLQDEGVFLNTWQWRAHRSSPIGYADPGFVLDARRAASGRPMYATNWDADRGAPLYMFNPEHAGRHALREDRLLARRYGQDDPYFLFAEDALPFDPDHNWRDGDVIPRRYLQTPTDGRASLRAEGRWDDGAWRVRVTRTLAGHDPRESKAIRPGESYHIAFAVHTGATQGRWHLVSLPLRFGVEAPGHLNAHRVEGDLDAAEAPWTEVPLFYPGQVLTDWLADAGHQLYSAYQSALSTPLDPRSVTALSEAIAAHERAWLEAQAD
ncbi:MAG: ethylbenzene dehydrogenase-related protein [Phycisphaerales bacterium]|nr:hypothetical protein [Planctomycetota bacterium]MCH8508949.1 ethylbenzene dehydrogenase-related protein [Phycisphaerales bacterium]